MISQVILLLVLLLGVSLLFFGVYWTIKLTRTLPSHLDDFYDGDFVENKKLKFFQIMR